MYCLLVWAAIAAEPKSMFGRVVSVIDGDTIVVLDSDDHQHKVRLAGIDAPERRQPYSKDAQQHLFGLVRFGEVRVDWRATDGYGRILGDVSTARDRVNERMVRDGYAWQFRKFDNTDELREAESQARDERRGLWKDDRPVPPWEWRAGKRGSNAPRTTRRK